MVAGLRGSGAPFFFQAEDGIRDRTLTGVQTCALPISDCRLVMRETPHSGRGAREDQHEADEQSRAPTHAVSGARPVHSRGGLLHSLAARASSASSVGRSDRKSTRLNSSHRTTSYAVFCLKKKNDVRDEELMALVGPSGGAK